MILVHLNITAHILVDLHDVIVIALIFMIYSHFFYDLIMTYFYYGDCLTLKCGLIFGKLRGTVEIETNLFTNRNHDLHWKGEICNALSEN